MRLRLLFLILTFMAAGPALAQQQTITLPLKLDFPVLRQLLIRQAFPLPGEKATIVNQLQGCTIVEISEPQIKQAMDYLALDLKVTLDLGLPLPSGSCLSSEQWQGVITFYLEPYLTSQWSLGFKAADSRLKEGSGSQNQFSLSASLWELVKHFIHPYLENLFINLSPPIKQVQQIIPAWCDPALNLKIKSWLENLATGPLQVQADNLYIPLYLTVDLPTQPLKQPAEPNPEQIAVLTTAWESLDDFLVFELRLFFNHPLSPTEHRQLYDLMLDTRYTLLQDLAEPSGSDSVRLAFAEAWQRLAPIFRRHLLLSQGSSDLSYLAFFTAADALLALEQAGPALGLDLSRQGLLRLAGVLVQHPEIYMNYSPAVDPALRTVLGLAPPLDEDGPQSPHLFLPWVSDGEQPLGEPVLTPWQNLNSKLLNFFAPAAAWAAPATLDEEIKPWVLTSKNQDIYLERVKQALRIGSDEIWDKSKLTCLSKDLFQQLILATAWQESCWRQFVNKNNQLTYLLSYNKSSVGIMQINERVWRGLYNQESLRWNILYNLRAGAEIMANYLNRNVAPSLAGAESDPLITARHAYAIYNGGPGNYKKYIQRLKQKPDQPVLFDRLFMEKYQWAQQAAWEEIYRCW